MEYEVGDIVLCTVDQISGTTVFVTTDDGEQGSIITAEIAPGRIRNLRDYVVPKKQIVCKVIRTSNGRLELSLRRVSQKEQKEVLELHKLEKNAKNILKSIAKEKTPEIIEKIKGGVYEFLQEAKKDSKELEKLLGKENTKKILEIINAQKTKIIKLKKELLITSTKENGLTLIKNLLNNVNGVTIKYISAGKYSITAEEENLKKADNKIKNITEELEKTAKKNDIDFKVKDKK